MSLSLRDQLLKTGLVNQAQAEARTRGKGQRPDNGRGEEEPAPPLPRTPENEQAFQQEVTGLISAHRLKGRHGGDRRWYYVTRDGRVPYVDVHDELAGQIEAGQVAMVETAGGGLAFIEAVAVQRIQQLVPERILVYRRRGGGNRGNR